MRKKLMSTTSIAALAFATSLATSAIAPTALADGYEPAGKGYAPAPVVKRWQGFYLGAHVGAGEANWGGAFNTDSIAGSPSETVLPSQLNTDGILGGVHGGYNWQFGRGVFGVEGDWSWMDWSDRVVPASTDASASITGEVDNLASVRARIGYVVGHDQAVLLFLSGGFAWADAEALVCTGSNCSTQARFDFDDVGGVVGGGFEYAMTDSFRLRVDGSYYWFNDNQSLARVDNGFVDSRSRLELEDMYTFRVGGTWYFTQKAQPVALK